MRIRSLVVSGIVALAGIAAVGGAGLTSASALQTRAAGKCGPTFGYIDPATATVTAHSVVIKGRRATLHCGGPDDSFYVLHEAFTLRMLRSGTVTVWNKPADPSKGTRKVAATALPMWLKRNRSEPIYRFTGPRTGVTKLVEEWHP